MREIPSRALPPAFAAIGLALALAACGGRSAGEPPAAEPSTPAASALAATAAPGASVEGTERDPDPSDLCGILAEDEVAEVLGTTPEPGQVAGPFEAGCQWVAAGSDAFLMIQLVPVDYFEEPGAREVRELEGIGEYAYVGPHAFGRVATARTADAGYLVIAAEPVDDELLVELLRTFVDRAGTER